MSVISFYLFYLLFLFFSRIWTYYIILKTMQNYHTKKETPISWKTLTYQLVKDELFHNLGPISLLGVTDVQALEWESSGDEFLKEIESPITPEQLESPSDWKDNNNNVLLTNTSIPLVPPAPNNSALVYGPNNPAQVYAFSPVPPSHNTPNNPAQVYVINNQAPATAYTQFNAPHPFQNVAPKFTSFPAPLNSPMMYSFVSVTPPPANLAPTTPAIPASTTPAILAPITPATSQAHSPATLSIPNVAPPASNTPMAPSPADPPTQDASQDAPLTESPLYTENKME